MLRLGGRAAASCRVHAVLARPVRVPVRVCHGCTVARYCTVKIALATAESPTVATTECGPGVPAGSWAASEAVMVPVPSATAG